jgi:transposase InsO family protein
MGIKRSTLYYRSKDKLDKKTKEAGIKNKITTISQEHPYYGYRRITAQLRRDKVIVNHKKVLKMMQEMGIQGRIKHKYVTTTDSKHNNKIYSNLIKDKELTGINQVWCADITYIRILNGFVYLAAILDIYSRRIVGYAIGKTLSPKLAITALNMAIATRKTDKLIHHSDQGIQYTCKDYIKILKDNGIRISMSGKGNPYDNAFAESFFKTLKQEEVYLWEYETFSDVVERIPYFIEDVYNRKRLHSSLGYRPPEEYERLLAKNSSRECIMAKTISV